MWLDGQFCLILIHDEGSLLKCIRAGNELFLAKSASSDGDSISTNKY